MSSEEQVPVTEALMDNTDQGRFELHRDGDLVGWLYYTHLKPNRYALLHTEVESSHRHQGVAGAMVRQVLDEIRARAGTITAICPFVADYLARTTTYADLIDARHPGYSDRAAAESAREKGGG
ncbi:N-acetyltransferase [Nonomuraea terrae]|uniref:N-acetyltransferase n=1 Tax=Nonomuraea terrae TaxID=2530383 RepID=A0A4R4Z5V2_9ACTN|nr:GNAT family N-acetyltransferase [Nonomuraea terrae]TDD53508.1 N-acetyltransferase [Nonomuraea terrae]